MNFPITIIMQQDHPTIRIQEDPEVIFVQYHCKSGNDGSDGADGISPDIGDPGTIQAIIDGLAGEITATELHQDLMTRIDKIDLGANSLEAQAALLQYGLDQINQSFGVVSGRLADVEGSVTVHDSQITTLGADLATLDGTAQGFAAYIESLDTRVTVTESDIESQATSITGLGAKVTAVEGTLVGQSAIVNALSADVTYIDGQMNAMATEVNTIQASVNANSAAIQTEALTRASETGDLYAKYSVKVDVNGKISGFGLQSTSTASLFEIIADRFAVVNSSGTGTQFPFIIDGGVVYISSAMIETAAIDTLRLAGTAVIVPTGVSVVNYSSTSISTAVTISGLASGEYITIFVMAGGVFADGVGGTYSYTTTVNSINVQTDTAVDGIPSMVGASHSATNGTYTYLMSVSPAPPTTRLRRMSLQVIGCKR